MPTEKEIVADELNKMAERIRNNIDSTGTTASGKTAKSMHVDITDLGSVLLTRRDFKGLEIGRPGGPVPKGFNEIIRQWIIDKGIAVTQIPYKRKESSGWKPKYTVPERSLNLAAGAIASGIKEKGTKLHQKGGRSDIYSNELPTAIANIKKRIIIDVKSKIQSNLK